MVHCFLERDTVWVFYRGGGGGGGGSEYDSGRINDFLLFDLGMSHYSLLVNVFGRHLYCVETSQLIRRAS